MKLTIFIVRHLIPVATYIFLWARYGWTWEAFGLIGLVILNDIASGVDSTIRRELKA